MKGLVLVAVGAALMAQPAVAQTSNTDCSKDYFGNVHCTTTTQPGVNWQATQQPPAENPMDAFYRGQREAQDRRLREAEIHVLEAQAAQLDQQKNDDVLAAAQAFNAQLEAKSGNKGDGSSFDYQPIGHTK